MLVVNDTREIAGEISRSVITIGNFDGVHHGHQALLNRVIHKAKELGGKSIVFTFHPHPLKVMAPEKCPPLISLPEQKIALFRELGLDILVSQNFTREFAVQSPKDFVELVLCRPLNPVEIFVGSDFRFGKDREGNVELLRKLGGEFDFKVSQVVPVTLGDTVVSSTMIRQLLIDGRVEEATELLSKPYAMLGMVVSGDARGRELGFPTANIKPENDIIPMKGVYAVKVICKEQTLNGIMNIGVRPTFNKDALIIEVFILDFDDDIYDQKVTLQFIARLRDEKAFSGPDELIAQINRDVSEARRILN